MAGFACNLDDRRGGRGVECGVFPGRTGAGKEFSLSKWDSENSEVTWGTAVPKCGEGSVSGSGRRKRVWGGPVKGGPCKCCEEGSAEVGVSGPLTIR